MPVSTDPDHQGLDEVAPSPGAVLVTGGAGYIGSHVLQALTSAGWRPVAFDDLSHGFADACLDAALVRGDIRDLNALTDAMQGHAVCAVVHLAGLIEVGRSMVRPDLFWDQNVGGTGTVLGAMRACGLQRLVFSSSAAVYGAVPGADWRNLLTEESPKAPSSPYGDTKLAAERMIGAHCAAFDATAVALRYFNAAGADPAGRLGEAHEPETHLIPLAIEAGLGRRGPLTVFGCDFETPDGSCLRDYIHVADLAAAHVAALHLPMGAGAFEALNVGTGRGQSVLEVIRAVERALGHPLPWSPGDRRAGDPACLVADPARAMRRLGWSPTLSSLDEIVATAARWHEKPRYGPGAKVF